MKKCDVLILGANGMLGSAILRYFSLRKAYNVFGTIRDTRIHDSLGMVEDLIIPEVNVQNLDGIAKLFEEYKPRAVINCVGLVKQLEASNDPLTCIPINSLLPHQLAQLCNVINSKLIHISTDCVFNGLKGMYRESDPPDANDLYGRSKLLGEVNYQHCITLRTSIIGHETKTAHSLLEWFLSQDGGSVRGFERAVFSGLPTVELARVIHDYVLKHKKMHGLYHVSSKPINKYDLLQLIASEYKINTNIERDDELFIDRSLDSTKFFNATGFRAKPWNEMVAIMRDFG